MKENKEQDQGLISTVKEYVNIRKDLAFLTIAEKVSVGAAGLVTGGVLAFLGFFVFFFGSLTLGFYLSEVIGNSYAGFLIITAFYLLLVLVVYFTKENFIKKPVENGVIKKIFNERNEGLYEKQN
jgi:hypothetical protein